jgi:hypothetical protein
MPQPRRRPDLATGVEADVPYDRTQLMGDEEDQLMPQAPPPGGGAPQEAPMDLGSMGQQPPMDLGAMGQDPSMGGPGTMGGGAAMPPSPEDAQVEQMAAALEDPNIDPQMKMQIEQQLALAARRQLAGLGG